MLTFSFLGSENQRQRQLELKFYFRSYISQRDQVGYNSGGGVINYILKLYPMVLTKYFLLLGLTISLPNNIFILNCGCLNGSNNHNLHLQIAF